MKSGTMYVRYKITLCVCVLGKHLLADCKGTDEGRPGLLKVNYALVFPMTLPSHFKWVKVQTEALYHQPWGLLTHAGIWGGHKGFFPSVGMSFVLVPQWALGQIRCPGVTACYQVPQPLTQGTGRGVNCCFISCEWVSRVFPHGY